MVRVTPAKRERIPPHDIEAEEALLGSMMISVDAIEAAIDVRPGDFYVTGNGIIFRSILKLHGEGKPVDPITVRDEIVRAKLEKEASPSQALKTRLLTLQASTPASANATQYATIVRRDARAREVLIISGEISEAIYGGDVDWQARAERLGDLALEATDTGDYSWEPVDLVALLAGEIEQVKPTMLVRADGEPLIYPGKIHAFNAEPEAGKTWLALLAVAEALDRGDNVVYFDFEDTAVGIVTRLDALGVPRAYIEEQLTYVRPDEPIDARARLKVQQIVHEKAPTLAVIDGVAEALAVSGLDENSNADVAKFLVALPRHLSRFEVTVIMIDHVTKTKESQGRYARGAGHKLAGTDVVYKLESVKPFGRGLVGHSKLVVQKDRHGWIRRLGRHTADLHLDGSGSDHHVKIALSVPEKTTDSEGHDRPTGCMEAVSKYVEENGPTSTSALRKKKEDGGLGFRIQTVKAAVEQLVAGKYVTTEDGPRGSLIVTFKKRYRADSDKDAVKKPRTEVPKEPDPTLEDEPWLWPDDEDYHG